MSIVEDLVERAEKDITEIIVRLEDEISQSIESISIEEGRIQAGGHAKPCSVRVIQINLPSHSGHPWYVGDRIRLL